MEHVCDKEEMLGKMSADLSNIKSDTDKIVTALEGKNGLVVKVSVHEDRFKTMPTPRSILIQASIWGGFTGATIVLGKLIFFG